MMSKQHTRDLALKPGGQPATTVGRFQLGDVIGQGAFGSVCRGLNMDSGEVVAVKQIELSEIPPSEVSIIMMEIDLLKKLQHPNIVKYLGFLKTKDHLCIILEFCENGSLQSSRKKFEFSESLVAVYIYQVLEGLIYLHDQGVIHRDIKAGNILTTKDGTVKLADFGVATKLNDVTKDDKVAGSPYWMAPEIVELSGSTTASDIWSVGCTIIELLTGEPPYFSLPPMAALFKIVQDDHPPISDSFSKNLVDFLLQCFMKDPIMRVTAKKLIKHSWLHNARRSRKQDHSNSNSDLGDLESDKRSSMNITENKAFNIDKFVDDSDMGFEESFLGPQFEKSLVLKLKTNTLGSVEFDDNGNEDHENIDPFSSLDDDNNDSTRDKRFKLSQELKSLIKILTCDSKDHEVFSACTALLSIFTNNPEIRIDMITHQGVIPILDILNETANNDIRYKVLEIINVVIHDNFEIQDTFCFLGGVPVVLEFAKQKYEKKIRKQAANFVKVMLSSNQLASQMFISCRGLQVLVTFLDEKYEEDREVVWIAIDGIHHVLSMPSPAPKNNFCVLLLKCGAFARLTETLKFVIYDKNKAAQEYVGKIINIINIFSRTDSIIKEQMSTRQILRVLVNQIEHVQVTDRLSLIKCIKNLSVSPTALYSLQKLDPTSLLVGMLTFQEGKLYKDMRNQALQILFNFCRINKGRQELAVTSGIIPPLKYIVEINNPLKQFALPILCDLSRSTRRCKDILWENDGFNFYMKLLNDSNNVYWQINALEAINAWILDDERAEKEILLPKNIEILINRFVSASGRFLLSIVEPLNRLVLNSLIARALSKAQFFQSLLEKLEISEVVIQLNLLKILHSLLRASKLPHLIVNTYDIPEHVEPLRENSAIMVREMAEKLLLEISALKK